MAGSACMQLPEPAKGGSNRASLITCTHNKVWNTAARYTGNILGTSVASAVPTHSHVALLLLCCRRTATFKDELLAHLRWSTRMLRVGSSSCSTHAAQQQQRTCCLAGSAMQVAAAALVTTWQLTATEHIYTSITGISTPA